MGGEGGGGVMGRGVMWVGVRWRWGVLEGEEDTILWNATCDKYCYMVLLAHTNPLPSLKS